MEGYKPPTTRRSHWPAIIPRRLRQFHVLVPGSLPDTPGSSICYVSGRRWGTRRYMDMNRLKEMQEAEVATAENAAA
jgi:membrane protein DedA with SNARE-associated domain